MKYLFALGLMAVFSSVQADTVGADDPLLRGTIYVDIARAGDRVVAVGDRGHVIYSDDEGKTWRQGETPTRVLLTSVCFSDAQYGWAVGHDAVVLGTRDGGQTWAKQYSDEIIVDAMDDGDDDYYDDDFYDDDLYGDDMYGDTGPIDTSGAPLLSVWCDTPDRAVAVGGYGYLIETTDAGDNWERLSGRLPDDEGWHLYAIAPLDGEPNTLIIAGERGTLFRSRDRGQEWERLESPYHGTFFGITSSDPRTLLVHGLQGNVWLSRDRGDSWQRVTSGVRSGVNDGAVLSDGTIVLVGNAGAMLTSRDQGAMLSLRFLSGRQTISAVLARKGGGVIIAGAGGLRVLEDVR
ncbi:MAG: hypothetical protein LAT61_14290 [Alcanivorax sp.]|nr:hypothetical protein [Alcanivorax sp.]